MAIPCIAIHGVGRQESGHIKSQVHESLQKTRFRDSVTVEEFNWDEFIEHSSQGDIQDLLWYLEATAENVSVSGRLGLTGGETALERGLGFLLFHLHRICQWLIAFSIGTILVGTISPFVMSLPSLLFGLSVNYGAVYLWLPVALTYSALAILLISGLIFTIGSLWAILSFSIRPLNVTLRSIALLYLQPVLVFVSGMFAIRWTTVTQPIWLFGTFFLIVLMATYAGSLFSDEPFTYYIQLKFLIYVLLGAGGLVLAQLWLSKIWFRTFVKVILDIFRYLGDPLYRLRVQQGLDCMLEELRSDHENEREFVILAHSLGSVIAVDSLLSSRQWGKRDTVYLVTMGSPIHRLFQRFFPDILFPASIEQLAQTAAGNVERFHWINVFRPFDYIGTSLGLSQHNVGIDASTNQKNRILSSHTDYWSDGGGSAVSDAISSAISRLEPTPRPDSGAGKPGYSIPSPPRRHALVNWLRNAAGPSAAVLSLSIFAGMIYWVSVSLDDRNAMLETINTRLRQEGIEVLAKVHYDRETIQYDKGSTYVHHFKIFYKEPGASQAKEKYFPFDQSTVFPEHRYRFDESMLADHIRSLCPDPWWKFWKWFSRGIPCVADNIRFRYLPDDTDIYDFPDFPSTEETRSNKASWFKTVWFSLFLTGLALIPLTAGGSFFMLLLGHAPFGRPAPRHEMHYPDSD